MKRYIKCASVHPAAVFNERDTGVSYYNNFLNSKDAEYMRKSKNRKGEVTMMTPEEYYSECASKIFQNSSVSSLKKQRNADRGIIKDYEYAMAQGDVFPLCYLNYADNAQEGLHRMMAAGNVFGWETKFPVLVVDCIDKRLDDLNNIWRWWCRATNEAEDVTYSADNWEEEFVEEVEYNLEHYLEEHYEVEIVSRRSQEEMDKYGSDYAIEIVLREFADIMRPQTIFTPKLKDPNEATDGYDFDLDDLDDIDLDLW